MTASYLVRLDDACPTMRRETWDALEHLFDDAGVRPIVGIIPENRDEKMLCSPDDGRFWERVRGWQHKRWALALHGAHHACSSPPKDARPLLLLHSKSEFAGLGPDAQRALLRRAWRVFEAEGVRPALFMAPCHSFDEETLRALRDETPIRLITDGLATTPFEDLGFVWIPQQLWRLRSLPAGLWTVCLHPNTMTVADVHALGNDLKAFRDRVTSVDRLDLDRVSRRRLRDRAFSAAYLTALRLKRAGRHGSSRRD
jgi:predicted deacetylase